jgi:hypothetical protein
MKAEERRADDDGDDDAAPETDANADTQDAEDPRCDLCGAPMLDRHCKLVCVQCGYMRDCSDP